MSEQQLSRIDGRLDRLEDRLDKMAGDVAVLQTDVAVLKADVGVLKADVGVLKADVGVLKTDVTELKAGQARLETRLEDVNQRIGVLHEELVDRIKALGRDDGARLEMRRTVAEVRSELATHATLDGDAHHYFANSLREHAQRLTSLEGRNH